MMNEKKYYVKLKSPNDHLGIWWCGDRGEWQSYSCYPIYEEELEDFGEREVIGWEVSKYVPSFTKTELSKIMDGALYKQRDCLPFQWLYSREQLRNDLGWEYNETIDKWEWKNQLIELVPVEED